MKDVTVAVRVDHAPGQAVLGGPLSARERTELLADWPPGLRGQQDEDWDWDNILDECPHGDQFRHIRLSADTRLQGLTILGTGKPFRSTGFVEGAVEIAYLATAPWSRARQEMSTPDTRFARVTPVGTLLMMAAIRTSRDLGHDGRLAWHSLPGAEQWYRASFPGLAEVPEDWDGDAYLTYFEADGNMTARFAKACLASGIPDCFGLV